jgi:arsenite/tail-anchored protein-transporting ATPase
MGKGGVGKTTVSTAYAVRLAMKNRGQPVLLLSTDPAHSLADVLDQSLTQNPVKVRLPRGKLTAWQVNATNRFRSFLNRHKENLLAILESGSIFSREDIEPLMDTAVPGIAEMSALLALDDALFSKQYQQIVVDTAPFGHTLRLFELPEHFQRFLNFLDLAASRDQILAEHFGGRSRPVTFSILEQWSKMVSGVRDALRNAEMFLVTTSEKFSLNESLRCRDVLSQQSPPIKFSSVVLNRAVDSSANCPVCEKRANATRAARVLLKREFPGKDLYVGEDFGAPVVGVTGLGAFAAHVFDGKPMKWKPRTPKAPEIRLLASKWLVLKTPLTLVVGKGGVGKTTISAALSFNTRANSKLPVEICSVDPAPSLDDIFQADINDEARPVLGDGKFLASEMDSVRLFRQWVAEVKQTIDQSTTGKVSGIHVDLSFERRLFSELLEIVPPGVDEVLAIVHIMDLLGGTSKRVVIDMAPTGHALDLLRTPQRILAWTRLLLKTLAAHRTLDFARDAGVKVAELGQRVRELLDLLKDPERSCIYTVMLPEPLPDRETERLMHELEELGLSSNSMFTNRVLFAADTGKCKRCRRARQWQMATMAKLSRRFRNKTIYAVRNFPAEIAGKRALRSFTGELWRAR